MTNKTNTPATGDGLNELVEKVERTINDWRSNYAVVKTFDGTEVTVGELLSLTAALRKKDEELAILRRAVERYRKLEASTIEVLTNRGLIERIGEQWRWYNYHDEVFNSLTEVIEEKTK